MKRKVCLISILFVIVTTFTVLIILNANNMDVNNLKPSYVSENVDEGSESPVNLDDYNSTWINFGKFEISENVIGNVQLYNNAIKKLTLKEQEKPVFHVGTGSYLKKGMLLYTCEGMEYYSETSGRVLGITQGNSIALDILDYTKSYLSANLQSKYQNYINESMTIIIENPFEVGKSKKSQLVEINPRLKEDSINVKIKNPFELLGATKVNIKIIYEEIGKVVYADKSFLKFDKVNSKWYVKILENNEITNHYVEIGASNDEFYQLINCDDLIGREIYKLKFENS